MNSENRLEKGKKTDESFSRPDAQTQIRTSLGPFGPDQAIRHAVAITWALIPEAERTEEKLEETMQSLLQRALRDFKEDVRAFNFGK